MWLWNVRRNHPKLGRHLCLGFLKTQLDIEAEMFRLLFLIQIVLFQLWPFKQTWTWQRSSCSWRWGPSRRTRRTSPPRLPWCCTFHAWLKDNLNFYSQREHPHRWKATLMYLACSLSSLSTVSTLSVMYLSMMTTTSILAHCILSSRFFDRTKVFCRVSWTEELQQRKIEAWTKEHRKN